MALPKNQPDPSTFITYPHAAAGHEGVCSDPTGLMVIKPCTPAEVAFYESATAHPAFRAYMPAFMGTLALNENQGVSATMVPSASKPDGLPQGDAAVWVRSGGKKLGTGLSIVLENVTAGFQRPNVIDLKLGARLWSDDAPEEKRRYLDDISNATTSHSLGFRIAGMRVHKPEMELDPVLRLNDHTKVEVDGYLSYDKHYGRSFSAENVHEAFVEFFGGWGNLNKANGTRQVANRLASEVRQLAHVLGKEESRMYSASILMVYEGDEEARRAALEEERRRTVGGVAGPGNEIEPDGAALDGDSEDDDDEPKSKSYDMRVIDFAHAKWTPGQGHDGNALQGVRSVLNILELLAGENRG